MEESWAVRVPNTSELRKFSETLYLNSRLVLSPERQAPRKQAPVLQLGNPGRETWLTCWVATETQEPDVGLLADFAAPRPPQVPGEAPEELRHCHGGWEADTSW